MKAMTFLLITFFISPFAIAGYGDVDAIADTEKDNAARDRLTQGGSEECQGCIHTSNQQFGLNTGYKAAEITDNVLYTELNEPDNSKQTGP